jgi:hypothetical protein
MFSLLLYSAIYLRYSRLAICVSHSLRPRWNNFVGVI